MTNAWNTMALHFWGARLPTRTKPPSPPQRSVVENWYGTQRYWKRRKIVSDTQTHTQISPIENENEKNQVQYNNTTAKTHKHHLYHPMENFLCACLWCRIFW
mmetsp:Transcript_32461/g.36318  ORF Transcript_32461/g.36318 Transcript_32461/m.36318 type:complete len:102 (+) Transcript_32461:28-333(+)